MHSLLLKAMVLSVLPALPLAAQTFDGVPYGQRPTSLTDVRHAVAWYGAHCVMDAIEIDIYGNTVSLASLAGDTGVPLADIAAVAQARGAEQTIAVQVLRAGGEPLRDPPEPFLSLLRQTQSDCQEYDRRTRILETEIARGVLPETAPPSAPVVLRADLDPIPFDHDRATRMGYVLNAVDDVRAAGLFEAELLALAQLISGRADLTLEDISGITDQQERRWIATELLLPNPDDFADLSEPEAAEVAARISSDYDGRFVRYYASLIAANFDQLGEAALAGGANGLFIWRDQPLTMTCRRIANSAAMRCDPV